MPTTRPRHVVTETDELARALDDAAQRWPTLRRPQLLARLALEGHRALAAASERRQAARVEAVRRHAGVATGCFGEGYLDEQRADWPQ